MLDSPDNQQPESPIEDTKSVAKAAKGVVETAKAAKTGIEAAKLTAAAVGTGGVGAAAMLALKLKGLLKKIPILNKLAPLIDKVNKLAKKIAAAIGAALAYLFHLLMALLSKIITLAASIAVGATIGFAVGGPIGALVGGTIGGLLGPQIAAFGAKTAGALKATGGTITSGISGITGGFTSAISGITSAIWGGITSSAGTILGGISSATSFLVNLVGGISIPTGFLSIPLYGAIGGVSAGTILLTGFVAPAAFFTAVGEGDTTPLPGQNQFFTLTKTATPTAFANLPTGGSQQVLFTVTLTALGTRLDNVQVLDEARGGPGGATVITTDSSGTAISPISCPTTLNPGEVCTRQITVSIDSRFNDSVVTNTVRVIATPEGQSVQTTAIIATVRIGSPSTQCPHGWPSTGNVSQGPEGSYSHGPLGLEAIDIGTGTAIGFPVYATVDGIVIYREGPGIRGPLNQLIDVQPISCPGLNVVRYQHLSAINVSEGSQITFGQIIGSSGDAGSGPHTHYQFNRINERNFRMEPPNIPQLVPRTCSGNCNVTITTAP